jgi:hypothetical protein
MGSPVKGCGFITGPSAKLTRIDVSEPTAVTEERTPRAGLIVGLFLVVGLIGLAVWAPRWWEQRLYRKTEALTGVGAQVLPGDVTTARRKIDPGTPAKQALAALGKPSISVGTQGTSTHEIWTYYYADGTMTVNLSDGIVRRVSLEYGPPRIPTSRRR